MHRYGQEESLAPCSLLEIPCCKNSLVPHCEIRSLIVAEVALSKESLITRCEIRLLLVAEVTRCKNLVSRCKIPLLLIAKIHSSLVKTITRWNYCLLKVNKVR